jgi:hypothetical protein
MQESKMMNQFLIIISCRPSERRKYVNLFEGLDNTKMMEYEALKKDTFKNIFSCTNAKAVSLKKPLNYINYSNENLDIISKKKRHTAYENFYHQCVEYEDMKAPFFDHELNEYMTIKRSRASLDKNCKKYITKNIKTCTPFAQS